MRVLPVVIGFFLDMLLGDPFRFHPVCLIGKLIEKSEKIIRKFVKNSKKAQYVGGVILTLSVSTISIAVSASILYLTYKINIYLGIITESIMCYQMLAMKSLKKESMKVYYGFKEGDINKAREAVSMIVGRDTDRLNEQGIIKAAIETVAENTSDGIIAPLFYMCIFGGVGGYFYKAVNTLDSMVGYKNDKYLYFGRFSAKTDDILNYIPSRLSALFMMAASLLCGYDIKNAYRIFKRDRYKHASPNSAQTEAVMAGALNIELAGDAYYFGKLYKKQTIGDKIREVKAEDIKRANRLMYASCIISFIIFLTVRMGMEYAICSWW